MPAPQLEQQISILLPSLGQKVSLERDGTALWQLGQR